MIETYKVLSGIYDTSVAPVIPIISEYATRGNSLKIANRRCHYNLSKYSISMRITNVWNSLPFSVVVRNFPSAAVSAATFGERPRQAADVAHLLLLAGSQRRCSVDRAGALKVCLRSVEIFDWKD